MNPGEKLLVNLYSDANGLSVNILEQLLANNCYVNIITNNKEDWLERTSKIVTSTRFSIVSKDDVNESIAYSYNIACFGFINSSNVSKDVGQFLKIKNFKNSKTLIVLPEKVYGIINKEVLSKQENVGVVYISDILGPRMDINSDLKLSTYLREILRYQKLAVSIGETLTPVFISDVARQIVKWLFAFGPFGKETLIKGSDISNSVFWISCSKILGNIRLISTQANLENKIPKNIETVILQKDLSFMIGETFKWIKPDLNNLSNTLTLISPKKKKIVSMQKSTEEHLRTRIEKSYAPPSSKIAIKNVPRPVNIFAAKNKIAKNVMTKDNHENKNINFVLVSILIILLFPIFLLAISCGLVYSSYLFLTKGQLNTVSGILSVNKIVSNINYFESKTLKYIPLLGQVYKETEYSSYLLVNISNVGIKALPLITTGEVLFTNVLQNNAYSVEAILTNADVQLQDLSEHVLVLEKKTIESANNNSLVAAKIISKIDFKKYNNLILQAINISKSLPEVLGEYNSKNYMILFQNNMELRPTGGFIGSFGLITFDKGRLSEFNVSDVYSADGQLKGHVEPPAAIRDYLNEANWWLRDSNWDPDFPISAKRVEWFLDKEIDKQVDGVIAIDLNPIKDFLKISGPIYLTDYGLDINDQNLYEKVQAEVQDNTFPGTHQKSSFLTALSRSILNKVNNIPLSQKILTLRYLYKNLEERHVQAYVHNEIFQEAISRLNWDGSVSVPACDGNCVSEIVGVVEANVGVNKANYFVNRSVDLDVKIKENRIDKSLTLIIKNNATSNLGLSGIYKAYIRLLVDAFSTDIKVVSEFGQNIEEVNPEVTEAKGRKEIGIFLEIYPGETKKVIYSWSSGIQEIPETYNLFFRKQAGVDEYPLSIRMTTPYKIVTSLPVFMLNKEDNDETTLQGNHEYWYNTTLPRDLNVRISI